MEEVAAGSDGEPDRGPKWVGRPGEMGIIVPSDPEVFTRRMTVLVTSLPTMGQPLRGVVSQSQIATVIPAVWRHVARRSSGGPTSREFARLASAREPSPLREFLIRDVFFARWDLLTKVGHIGGPQRVKD